MRDDMYVCMCNAVCCKELKDVLEEHPDKSEKEIMDLLSLSKGCGICKDHCINAIQEIKNPSKGSADGEW